MASFLFLLLSAFCLCAAEAQQRRNGIISLGSSLTPTSNSSWPSVSGLYAFGFFQQGNGYAVGVFVAGIPQKTVVWTANREDPTFPDNVTLILTSEGRLILQQAQGQEINIASPSPPATSASMLDSGNFVLYSSNRLIVWQSFDSLTETLLPGQRLSPGEELVSSVSETDHSIGIFRLKMQNDGNLVQYPVNTPDTALNSYWSSNTVTGGGNVSLNLDDDGHLYLLNSSLNIKNFTAGRNPREGRIYMVKIDANGIFRLYSHELNRMANWSVEWSSSGDQCDPKGLCGLNGFCVVMDDKASCSCLPGFDFVQPSNWSSGCERNFNADSCKINGGNPQYNMRPSENTMWEDDPYRVLEIMTKEECSEACLKDCNCEAVLFNDRQCKMQRLPLRYGRRLLSDSTIAFVKVGRSVPITEEAVPANQHRQGNKELHPEILIISVSLVACGLLFFAVSGVMIHRNRVWAYRKILDRNNIELSIDDALRAFTYTELEEMTDNFKEELGRGAFGTVYKGNMLNNQKLVAVKRLEKVLAEGETEFQTEMKVIGKTHHRNLVRLLGYCIDGPNRLLVYEYMSNGSLADIFVKPQNKPNWEERIGIASNIAKGILYLHEECETQIIHCDIKPQNILLDQNWCAKISDFGLAKLLKPDQTNTFTGIRGTRGYVAPEWHRKLPVTVKADVYSFGIVLLQIICWRKSIDWSLPEDEAIIEEWVYTCFENAELGKLVGSEVVDFKKLERFVRLAIWCIQDEPTLRPSMKKVVLMLEGTVDIPLPPSPTSFLSII